MYQYTTYGCKELLFLYHASQYHASQYHALQYHASLYQYIMGVPLVYLYQASQYHASLHQYIMCVPLDYIWLYGVTVQHQCTASHHTLGPGLFSFTILVKREVVPLQMTPRNILRNLGIGRCIDSRRQGDSTQVPARVQRQQFVHSSHSSRLCCVFSTAHPPSVDRKVNCTLC